MPFYDTSLWNYMYRNTDSVNRLINFDLRFFVHVKFPHQLAHNKVRCSVVQYLLSMSSSESKLNLEASCREAHQQLRDLGKRASEVTIVRRYRISIVVVVVVVVCIQCLAVIMTVSFCIKGFLLLYNFSILFLYKSS